MAKKPRQSSTGRGPPPDPGEDEAFVEWLRERPRDWAVVIACRSALRALPLLGRYRGETDVVLPAFRAIAISRLTAKYKYPSREIVTAAAAARGAATRGYAAYAADAAAYAAAAAAYAAAAAAAYAADVYADAAVAYAADAYANAVDAYSATSAYPATAVDVRMLRGEVRADAARLHELMMSVRQLAFAPLWQKLPPPQIGGVWQGMGQDLRRRGHHWSVWIDWYDDVLHGASDEREDYHAAFTDLPGELPWSKGAEAVNTEIARRLQASARLGLSRPPLALRNEMLDRLVEIASPQPMLTDDGRLDAIPNRSFDVPTVDDDLVTLPLRQMNLIKIILSDLPQNAPAHLKVSLKSYERELKARGVQPILPLLKDDADIIAAAVHAPRAEDEWLEPGQRKAFERFNENHHLFVKHFPLDVERETLYAQTGLDEAKASGKDLVQPFEEVAEAAQDAHRAGAVTDDFVMVIEKMTELARVLSTQPTTPATGMKAAPDLKISLEDRIQSVTTKKRVLFSSLGFYAASVGVIASLGRIATTDYVILARRLKDAVEALSRFMY